MIDFGKLSGLAYRFRLIVDGLRRTVPEHQAKDRSSGPMVGLIWSDLGRRMARFERLLARIEAGIPDRVRPSRAGRAAARREVDTDAGMDAATDAAPKRTLRLPTRTGWLMLMMPWVVAPYGSQLRYWLMEPEAEALVRSSRQLRRLLRPLLRSLSTDPLPECLLEPEAEPKPKPQFGAPASGENPEGAATTDATGAAGATGETRDAVGGAPEPHAEAARERIGRVARHAVARAAKRTGTAAQALEPGTAQAVEPSTAQAVVPATAQAVLAASAGAGAAPPMARESPPPDWWSVQDERRRAALAIARGSSCRA